MRLIPDSEQEEVINSLLNNESKASLIAGETGTGKTLITVEFILRANMNKVLIVCPKNTSISWEMTLRRQGYEGNIVHVTKNNTNESVEIMREQSGVYIIGREFVHLIRKSTTKRRAVNWKEFHFDLVVYDEVHGIMNRKSRGFEAMLNIPSDYNIGLSATPSGNRFDGLWAVCRWLWRDLIPGSYWQWRYEWCRTEVKHFGPQKVEKVVGEKEPGKFVSTLPNYHRMELELDVDYIDDMPIYVELVPSQRKVYSQMESDLVAWLEDNPMVAQIPVVKRIRLREITLGMPSIDSEGAVFFDSNCASAKLDAVKEFLLDHEGPLLVFTHSKKFAKVAAERLGAMLWTGDQSQNEREEIKRKFVSGEEQILVATIASVAEGTDGFQSVCNTVVWLSRDDSGVLNEQAAGRLYRRGQKEHVRAIDIIARDTYDEGNLSRENQARFERVLTLRGGTK